MSNELNNIISRATNGVYEGVAIGGDRYELSSSFSMLANSPKHAIGFHHKNIFFRYPGTVFMDHLVRYNNDPNVKMLVLLGEVSV